MVRRMRWLGWLITLFALSAQGADQERPRPITPEDATVVKMEAGWDEADIRGYLQAHFDNFGNRLQLPYLRIPGAYSYWQALDMHLAEAASGQLSPEAALKAAAVDFEEITLRLGRERQRRAYRASLGL